MKYKYFALFSPSWQWRFIWLLRWHMTTFDSWKRGHGMMDQGDFTIEGIWQIHPGILTQFPPYERSKLVILQQPVVPTRGSYAYTRFSRSISRTDQILQLVRLFNTCWAKPNNPGISLKPITTSKRKTCELPLRNGHRNTGELGSKHLGSYRGPRAAQELAPAG